MHRIGHTQLILREQLIFGASDQGAITIGGIRFMSPAASDGCSNSRISEYTPMMKYFEQSCYPNVLRVVVYGQSQSVMITTRPIKQGERVFRTSAPIYLKPKRARQDFAPNCECSRCNSMIASPEQRQQLPTDPVFAEFMANKSSDDIKTQLEKCTILLQKSMYCMHTIFKILNFINRLLTSGQMPTRIFLEILRISQFSF